jgi:hypothetical protein
MSGAMMIKKFICAIYHSDVFGELINKIIGAGDGDRTRDIRLGNFISNLMLSCFVAKG